MSRSAARPTSQPRHGAGRPCWRVLVLAALLGGALLGCQRGSSAPEVEASPAAPPPPPNPVGSGVLAKVTLTRSTGNLTRAESEVTVLLSDAGSARAWVQLFPRAEAGGGGARRPAATGGADEPLNVAPGVYDVRVALREGELTLVGWARDLVLLPGESARLEATVSLAVGYLIVDPPSSEPLELVVHSDAGPRIDSTGDALVVRKPAADQLALPAGSYRVALVDPKTGATLAEHPVAIVAGQRSVLAPPPRAQTGLLSVRVIGMGSTGGINDAELVALRGDGTVVPLTQGGNTLPAGELTVRAELRASKLVAAKAERSTRLPPGGAVNLEITLPISYGHVRILSEPEAPGCRVSARTKEGLDEVAAGEWLAVPRGEVDLTLRCPDRGTRRFPGLVVEAGDRQSHTVRW